MFRKEKYIYIYCHFILCNTSFIDQACSVKMAGYWPRSFFCVFMDHKAESKSINTHEINELANISKHVPTSK